MEKPYCVVCEKRVDAVCFTQHTDLTYEGIPIVSCPNAPEGVTGVQLGCDSIDWNDLIRQRIAGMHQWLERHFAIYEEDEEMEKTFAYHKPSSVGLEKITKLREAYSALLNLVKETAPHTRERSEAITCLETSGMWAIKSVVCNDPESEVEQPTEA